MSNNALQTLLARMENTPITRDWGAIWTINRSALNRLLQQHYLHALANNTMLEGINGSTSFEDETTTITLNGVLFAPPRLTFIYKGPRSSRVIVTLDMIAGTYREMHYPTAGEPSLRKVFDITPNMGFHLEMEVELAHCLGGIVQLGYLTLDLTTGWNYRCNLSTIPMVQEQIGHFLCQRIAIQPANRYRYLLPLIDLANYQSLSPRNFALRTQAAPGADNPESDNYQDGAVVLFTRTFALDNDGGIPPEEDYPYFVPDDKGNDGRPLYDSALVINHDLILDLTRTEYIENLKQNCVSGANTFVESEDGRHSPYDMLIVGNLEPTNQAFRLEPEITYVAQEAFQAFQAFQANTPVMMDNWQVSCLSHPYSNGNLKNGVYQSTPAEKMANTQLPMRITASTQRGDITHHAHALVINSTSELALSPQCQVNIRQALPVELRAQGPYGGEIDWTLQGEPLGTIEKKGPYQAIFTPHNVAPTGESYKMETPTRPLDLPSVSLQLITARDQKENVEATMAVVISHYTPLLSLSPSYVPSLAPGDSRTFQLNNGDDPQTYRWSVLGEGDIDKAGRYTAPAVFTQPVAIIICELLRGEEVIRHGFSVIHLTSPASSIPSWRELEQFTLTPLENITTCFANGYQQIPVLLTLETKPVIQNGETCILPISDYELGRLNLVDASGNELPFLDNSQEGVTGENAWAVSRQSNRFTFYSEIEAQTSPQLPPLPMSDNSCLRYCYLYLHTTEANTARTFSARFRRNSGAIVNADNTLDVTAAMIPIPRPTVEDSLDKKAYYHLVPRRVSGDEGNESDSIDYYFIFYHRDQVKWVKFVALRMDISVLSAGTQRFRGNTSTIRWETETPEERRFSYTGYAFFPLSSQAAYRTPCDITFDPLLYGLARFCQEGGVALNETLITNAGPTAGEMIVSLNRAISMLYWDDEDANGNPNQLFRARLEPATDFELRDEEGNIHRLSTHFDAPGKPGSRHRLIMTVTPTR